MDNKEDIIAELQLSQLVRLASLCVRTIQSRDRHFAAAEKFKTQKTLLSFTLIIISSFTTMGVLSLLSGDLLNEILKNNGMFLRINFLVKLFSATLATTSTAIGVILIFLNLDERIVKHELAGHNYTILRDDTISLADKIRFHHDEDDEHEVRQNEHKANSLAQSSPTIPRDIHSKLLKDEKARKKERGILYKGRTDYWLNRFYNIKQCPGVKDVVANADSN